MAKPEVPEEVRAQFVAAVVTAKSLVYGDPAKCPFTLNSTFLDGLTGPEFRVVVREDKGFTVDRLVEIVSPHPIVVLLSLKGTLDALEKLSFDAKRRAEEEGEGDVLAGVGR